MATRSLIQAWAGRDSPLDDIFNAYGPTETTISCATGRLTLDSPPENVGNRLGGAPWIVDESDHNRLMPIGSVGELVVSSALLAREYLNNSELTAEVFIEGVPWLVKAGQREGI